LTQGLIHRDIKPANILLDRASSLAKIVDLGLAQRTVVVPGNLEDMPVKTDSCIVGTPLYMSPEQHHSPAAVDFRSDIYSLGATLYHASVGIPPFPAAGPLSLAIQHAQSPVPSPNGMIPDFPSEVTAMLEWMLKKKQADRPSSYDELILGFQEALN